MFENPEELIKKFFLKFIDTEKLLQVMLIKNNQELMILKYYL